MTLRLTAICCAAIAGAATSADACCTGLQAQFYPDQTSNITQWTKSAAGTGGTLSIAAPITGTLNIDTFGHGGSVSLTGVPVQLTEFDAVVPDGSPAVISVYPTTTIGSEIPTWISFSIEYSGAAPLVVGSKSYPTGSVLLAGGVGAGFSISGPPPGPYGYSIGPALVWHSVLAHGVNGGSADFLGSSPVLSAQPGQAFDNFNGRLTSAWFINSRAPEPSSWVIMLAGLCTLGAAIRGRRGYGARS